MKSSRARRGCRDVRSLRPRLLCLALVALPVLSAHHHPPAFSREWGSIGSAEGEFDGPSGVALAPGGQVYVADRLNHRVQKFDADGGFQEMWGWGVDDGANAFQVCTAGCQAGIQGSGDRQFTFPLDVAATPSGDVLVLNIQQVQKLAATGSFLTKWGMNGDAEGQFGTAALGLALDGSGNVYVSDNSHRIQKFSASGTFLRMWGWGVDDGANAFQVCTAGCQAGIQGAGEGQFAFPQDLVADRQGNIYVADSGNQRVQKFDGNGAFLAQWGSPGIGESQFNNPLGIAIDNRGVLYVTEQNGHRVQEFDLQGTFLRMWGWGVQDGSSEFQVCTSGCQPGLVGSGEGQFNVPNSLQIGDTSGIYVIDSGNDRVQKFQVPLLHFLVADARGPVRADVTEQR